MDTDNVHEAAVSKRNFPRRSKAMKKVMKKMLIAGMACVCGAALLAGCGGDSGSKSGGEKQFLNIATGGTAGTASRLFQRAHKALETADIPEFEDKIIFIVDYVLNAMQKNKLILRFISKNLSWGIFRQAITNNIQDDEGEILAYFSNILLDHPTIKLRAPETMLFLIIELASSTSYSTILDNDPMSFEELKPYLNESIRAIIRNHIIEDTAEN